MVSAVPSSAIKEVLAMANNILRFPKAGGCRPWVIAHVRCEDSGVGCYDNNGNPVGWVPTSDPVIQQRVSDAIMDCLDAGKRFEQPDWDKLLRPE